MSSFFQFSLRLCWRVTVIELWKLFSTSIGDKFRLNIFLNKLKPGGVYEHAVISFNRIKAWEEVIAGEKDNIENLRIQRNNVNAHKDLDHDTVTNTVSLKKTE
ncbi:hypothetical protein [Flavihumibacter sp.]|uniref:hypothetical protein n=1 Tax=Flavihumibacter sp. TaxID=1913981 RepID=UPI002FC7F0F5